jgi:hypothetical protein
MNGLQFMANVRSVFISIFCFLPIFASYSHDDGMLYSDLYLYKLRKGHPENLGKAMDYIDDLNRRIAEHRENGLAKGAIYLTDILTSLLVTGGPFGLRATGPTPAEWKSLSISFAYIGRYYGKYFEVMTEGEIKRWKKSGVEVEEFFEENPSSEQFLTESMQRSIKEKLKSEKVEHKRQQIHSQANAVVHYAFVANHLKSESTSFLDHQAIKSALGTLGPKKPTYAQQNISLSFRESKAVLKDRYTSNEFYMLETSPDGACWMHAMAGSNGQPSTGAGFVEELLGLDSEKPRKVCEFAQSFFYETLVANPKLLVGSSLEAEFKKIREQEKIDENIGENPDFSSARLVTFLTKQDVFRLIVNKRGSLHDNTALLTLEGGNVWNSCPSFTQRRWPEIWAFLHRKNVYSIPYEFGDFYFVHSSFFLSSLDDPWVFIVQGRIHFSALQPMHAEESVHMAYATQGYANLWHSNL